MSAFALFADMALLNSSTGSSTSINTNANIIPKRSNTPLGASNQAICACAACIATMTVYHIRTLDGTVHLDIPVPINREYLRNRARWIRDELDPVIARQGPDSLHADNVITLFTFFEELRASTIPLDTIRYSRMQYALLEIVGRATRWPAKLIDCATEIVKSWESLHGPLSELRAPLFDPGGRLHGISSPEDVEKERLMARFLKSPTARIAHSFSRRHGDIGFKPGDWWINPMFAYHDGIIDNGSSTGSITCCQKVAYAILLTHEDELASTHPNHFTYRPKDDDPGRYRLTAATMSSRQPVRILRSHTLRSLWSPRAGVRYDGLYRVTGWTMKHDPKTQKYDFDISFTRVESQPPMKEVLSKPSAEDVDDYNEFKLIRWEVRHARNTFHRAQPLQISTTRHVHKPYDDTPLSPKSRKRSLLYTETTIATPYLPVPPTLSSSRPSAQYAEGVDDRAARIVEDATRHDSVAVSKPR